MNNEVDGGEIRKSTEKYIEASAAVAEGELSLAVVKLVLGSTEPINKLISSMLIVSGATITLSISNSDDVLSVLGSGTLKLMLALFVVSAICGFAARICSVLVDIFLSVIEKLQASIDEAYGKFSDDRQQAMTEASEIGVMDVRWIDMSIRNALKPLRYIFTDDAKPEVHVNGDETDDKQTDSELANKLRPVFFTLLGTVISAALQAIFLLMAIVIAITGIE